MRRRHGFTLVELLVVVAIIALLLSLLLPSLEAAREQARTVVCGTHMKEFNTAASIYANEFDGWLPGSPGTTGAAMISFNDYFGDDESYAWQDKAYVATSAWDWASPMAHYGLGWRDLPKDRRERMERIREGIFRCTSNNFLSAVYPDSAASEWPVTTLQSYTTVRAFMFFPPGTAEDLVAMPSSWDVRTPTNHRPRLGQLEKPGSKVYLAEGARFNDRSQTSHTYNVEYDATVGGAFSTDGASSGYSRGYINPIQMDPAVHDARFDRVTYRHLIRSESGMNGLFFDGHVEQMTKTEAILGVDLWWPSNSAMIVSGDTVLELEPSGFNPKPRANKVASERPQQDGTPWGLAGQQVITIN